MKYLNKLNIIVFILATLAICAGTALAVPIPNGNFESGNTGFLSSYVPNNISGGMLQEGSYAVDDDPNDVHILWSSFGDHTTGAGNMMIVNGSTDAGVQVWASPVAPTTIDVTFGQQYYFSAWLASVYPALSDPPIAPAILAFSINGVQIGADFTLSAPVGTWQQFYVPWVADDFYARLALVNRNTIAAGNDFAIDDIGLDTRIPGVPEPTTMLLLGLGLVGLAGVRRKFQK